MQDAVREKLLKWKVEADPSRLRTVHSLSGPPASGKNTVLEAVSLMAKDLMATHGLGVIERFTTRPQEMGEEKVPHITLDRLQHFERNGELFEGQILHLPPDVSAGTPLRNIHEQLTAGLWFATIRFKHQFSSRSPAITYGSAVLGRSISQSQYQAIRSEKSSRERWRVSRKSLTLLKS